MEVAVAELRDPQAQELGEAAVDPQVPRYPNASAPIRAMPISASPPLASNPLPAPSGPHSEPRARDIYRFTVEETTENGNRAYATLDRTAPGKVSGVEVTPHADHVVPVPMIRIVRDRSSATRADAKYTWLADT